ncbi:heme biosynthesis protein HemY [Nereida sp. MMG025]|uniref:heme biosynthesis protein HemY n=1 Tax=Nereida sp. MMG025 TaxID=2909981 RepID=UPI001F157485|nr:heme biosynthesis HemY N-terminal domain-containing protein [Nereida sp. MMG025]MCF6444655.1 heme biosynthesis protein HemY [Nereida sp. MMG025]
MLWSLIKILLFFAIVAALAFGAVTLLSLDGDVQITFGGVERTFGPLETVIALVVLVVAVYLLLKIFGLLVAVLKFINGDDTAISRYFVRNRERKGFEALSDGLMALASGEGRLAMSKASKAEKYLRKPELTNLITAQAAEMVGDKKKADQVYKALLQNEQTRFVGVRGIMKQKLADGDTDTALALAEKAFALKPKHEETQDVLLRLQAQKQDWSGARQTLSAKLKHGSLPRDVHKRRDAVLAVSEAKDVVAEGNSIEARETAIEANRLSPDLIPAAVMAARSYIEQDKGKYAARVLKKAWDAQPHPELAAAFAQIAPDEDAQARIKRFSALTRSKPDHPETKMLLAELNIAAEDFPQARKAIGSLVEDEPTARSLTIMAAIERGEGSDDAVVRGWLTKALSASRGPQWVCDNCQNIHSEWTPTCTNCGAFDTLSWKVPPSGETAMPASTEMLPLLVGTPNTSDTETAVVDVAQAQVTDAEIVEPDDKK